MNVNELLKGIFSGEISVFNLPLSLFEYTVLKLDSSLMLGFGVNKDNPAFGSLREQDKARAFRANLGRFSGAKAWHEVNDLTKAVFDENGFKRSFSEFKKIALDINANYNKHWLRTERDSVFTQSQNARKWLKFEAEKDFFPMLEYVTVGDSKVRKSHADLNGLVRRVDDPIWNKIMPQNGWRCRCIVIQHTASKKATSDKDVADMEREINADFKKKGTFAYNPGKEEYIFKEIGKGKHDYFRIPREFSQEQLNNFGFPSVSEITGRNI